MTWTLPYFYLLDAYLEDMLPHSVEYWNFSSAIPTKKKQNKQYFNRVDRKVKTYTMSWCSPLKWSPKEKWATSELTSANMIPFFLLSAARRGSQSRTQPKKKLIYRQIWKVKGRNTVSSTTDKPQSPWHRCDPLRFHNAIWVVSWNNMGGGVMWIIK